MYVEYFSFAIREFGVLFKKTLKKTISLALRPYFSYSGNMKAEQIIQDYKSLLSDLIETGEDMLELDKIASAQGLSLATQRLSSLISTHENELNDNE